MALRKYPSVTVTGFVRRVEPIARKTGEVFASRLIVETPSGGRLAVTAYEDVLSHGAALALDGKAVEFTAQIGARSFERKDGSFGAALEVELAETAKAEAAASAA